MRYRVLGSLEVHDGSRTVTLPQGRQRLLLAVLLTHANTTVTRDHLVDDLWGEAAPPSAAGSLHNLVSALRKQVGGDALETRDGGYVLRVAPGELDAERFALLAREGGAALARGDPETAAVRLREGLALWRGPPLGELAYHPALAGEAARLDEARLVALEDRMDADLARGHHADVLPELEALVTEHPLRERLRAAQMLALYRGGRQADALSAYRDARERLVGELGIEPGPALRRMEQAVLAQDEQLGAPDALPPSPPAVAWARRHAGALAGAGAVVLSVVVTVVLLTGRQDEAPLERAAVAPPGDYVAAIDPATARVIRRLPVGDTPTAVTVGAGAVWTINADGNTVSRTDLETRAVATFAPGPIPLDIAASEDAVWLVGGGSNLRSVAPPATLHQLDGASGAPITDHALPPADGMTSRTAPQLVAVAGDSVWAIGRTGRLQRVDVDSGQAREVPGIRAERVAASGDELWVIAEPPGDRPRAPNLLRLDPRTGAVRVRRTVRAHSIDALAVGAGGVWIADSFNGSVWRVDPNGGAPPRQIPVDPGVDGVAVGDGAVWTTNSLAGTVARIDPTRNRVTDKLSLDAAPRGIAVGAGQVWVSAAGRAAPPAGTLAAGASVQPVASRDCGPVLTAPGGDADLLIVYDDVFEGGFRSQVEAVNAAIAFVLRARDFRAGRFRLGLQTCNDGLAQEGFVDPPKCQANARAYARDPDVIGVIGPSHSICTEAMLPVLNRAPGGPVSIASHANGQVALVRDDPFAPAGLEDELFPTGRRGYVRIMPSDDYEAAAAALYLQQQSRDGVFLVTDRYAGPAPIYFRRAARRIGLRVTGAADIDRVGARGVVRRIHDSGADAVYVQSSRQPQWARLAADLTVLVSSADGLPIGGLFDELGERARTMKVTIPGQPLERLGPTGRRFVEAFGATRPGGRVPTWAVYGAAATEAMLDAIERSDGTRESVARALGTVDLADSPLGRLRFTPNGEPVSNPVAIVRVDHGGEPEDGVTTAGGEVVEVIDPPERLVGAGR